MAKDPTFIQAAIPADRGKAKHIEERSNAYTAFSPTGLVDEIHTTPDSFRRVHEVLHARHTKIGEYSGIRNDIRDIVEDCRLHSHHWPWPIGQTPKEIVDSGAALLNEERELCLKARGKKDSDDKNKAFSDFASCLRLNTVGRTMGGIAYQPFASESQKNLAYTIDHLIATGKHKAAAAIIEEAFFSDDNDDDDETEAEAGSGLSEEDEEALAKDAGFSDVAAKTRFLKKKKKKAERLDPEIARALGGRKPNMQIVPLPLTHEITHEVGGFRVATSGSRLHRPSLRRPVLPQRIFWKRSPVAPEGAILFDASGSMDVTPQRLMDCCLRAPMATIAYYCGYDGDGKGFLFIFAMNGYRASELDPRNPGGNAVDGPALDWLMAQSGPRMFVTDRDFCGARDSNIQIVRLENLERNKELTVYESYPSFQKAFPKVEVSAS